VEFWYKNRGRKDRIKSQSSRNISVTKNKKHLGLKYFFLRMVVFLLFVFSLKVTGDGRNKKLFEPIEKFIKGQI
jgi:hypothetical protein